MTVLKLLLATVLATFAGLTLSEAATERSLFPAPAHAPGRPVSGKVSAVEWVGDAVRNVDIDPIDPVPGLRRVTGHLTKIEWASEWDSGEDVKSFTLTDSSGSSTKVHVPVPSESITAKIKHAIAQDCTISVWVLDIGGRSVMQGGANAITLSNCN